MVMLSHTIGNTQSLQPSLFSDKVSKDRYTVTAAQSNAKQNITLFFLIL